MEGTGTKYDKNTGNYETNLKTNFTISKKQIKSDNYSYELKYPEGIIVPDELLNNEYRLLDGQQESGTYSFVKNTDGTYSVRVVFDQSYVNNAGDTIKGNIWFNGKLSSTKVDEQGNIVIAGQDKVNLNIPSRDITYPDDETNKYNIDVSKEGSVIEGGKLKYTVKINSTKGTPDKIDFTDIINVKNMSLETPEVSVKKQPVKWYSQQWQAVDSSKEESVTVNPTYDATTGKLTMELPKLTATKQNDYIDCFQYVVTYTYDITGMDVASTKAGNTVNVKYYDQKTDTTVKDTASTNIDVNNPYTISKSGKIADGKKIEWKITVNDKKANIAGATVSDTMFKDIPSDADIKVSPATGYRITKGTDGKIENIQFESVKDKNGDDTHKNTNTYTITYYTVAPANTQETTTKVIEAGSTTIEGLDDNTDYYLYEIKAPIHYNKLKAPVKFKIAAEYNDAGDDLRENYPIVTIGTGDPSTTLKADVINESGSNLPSTGGIGTTIFYVVGGILMVGAAVLLITKRRAEN